MLYSILGGYKFASSWSPRNVPCIGNPNNWYIYNLINIDIDIIYLSWVESQAQRQQSDPGCACAWLKVPNADTGHFRGSGVLTLLWVLCALVIVMD